MRIDKFLWCVRLSKTRTLAAETCKNGHIKVNDLVAKPSRDLNIGETIHVKQNPIWRSYKILGFPPSRVGAKLVATYITETTSPEELAKLQEIEMAKIIHEPGSGRPTKKDRRDLEKFKQSWEN